MTHQLVNLAVTALWKLSDVLRCGAEGLDDAASHVSRFGYRLLDAWIDRCERQGP